MALAHSAHTERASRVLLRIGSSRASHTSRATLGSAPRCNRFDSLVQIRTNTLTTTRTRTTSNGVAHGQTALQARQVS